MLAKTPEDFRAAVAEEFKDRDDASTPEDGWPWPWKTSATTDYAYCFEDGVTKAYCFGCPVVKDADGEHADTPERTDWPDMSDRVFALTGGGRSRTTKQEGTMVLTKEQQEEFEATTRPLIRWLNDNCHPHVKAILSCTHAELTEGICGFPTMDYVKD